MSEPALQMPEVAHARRYAAAVRVLVALVGGALLAIEPEIAPYPEVAGVGLAIIGLTGLYEWLGASRPSSAIEETLACASAITIVGWSEGQLNAICVLWLVAAAAGVMARCGRVGWIAPVIVALTLLSPLVTVGGMSAQMVGFAFGTAALLLVTARISREATEVLRRARHDAAHDPLTGLLSRAAFRDRVASICATADESAPAALIALDLDDFGSVNSRFGRAAADRLLIEAADAIGTTLREHDIAARVGGDEFAAVVLTDDAEPVARRLLAALQECGAPACAGIALVPRDGTDADSLLGAADVALRLTKGRGTAAVGVYDGAPITSDRSDGAQAALSRLCRGEGLSVAVQPIVDVDAVETHAYEALARFATRDGHGPIHWFALADEVGMRSALELACLRKALGLLDDLPAGSRLTVNLSALMLVDESTAALLAEQPDISRLVVEVTEETLVRHGPVVERTVESLRARGARFAVDDVGAGYSGLGQLAVLRPDYIKLDRELVSGIDFDPGRVSLIRALAEYAQDTDGLLVAEGVETRKELTRVIDAGATLVQGYVLARPGDPWPAFDPDPLTADQIALAG